VNKSDKLDELRLEVGMVADQALTRLDFYFGIINSIGKHIPDHFALAIYICEDYFYSCIASYSDVTEIKREKFGDGVFSICSIRGKIVITNEKGKHKAYAPFYEGQQQIGVFYVECSNSEYDVTEEDLIFLKEIIRYIEIKGQRYKKSFN
jgi:L-methionine (R)-S-oxide reductase